MSDRSNSSLERLPARRQFLIGAAATLICAPTVVRFVSLMPVRGVIHQIERNHYGFVERLYVYANLPAIIELQNAGLSAHGIAAEMNSQLCRSINGESWDAGRVIGLLTCNKNIQRENAIRRAEKMLSSS